MEVLLAKYLHMNTPVSSTLHLKPDPTLSDYQAYVAQMIRERGFADEPLAQTFMLFLEEAGEMAKAARKFDGMRMGTHSAEQHLDEEIKDVFILLLKICDQCGVDLEKAFRDKEEINKRRTWKR
jgi:NTP pyrophosphatase (non-canonical NTP hydrolase)